MGGQWLLLLSLVLGVSSSLPSAESESLPQCLVLPNPSNGVVRISTSPVGGVATYSCFSGHTLVGSSSRICLSDGSWSGQQPSCIIELQCPPLTNPTNGRVVISSRSVGVVARYVCLSGYSVIGTSSRSCQSDGSWSGEQPSCVLKQCPILLNPANGRVSFSSRSVGGVAIYSCLSGYSLVGSRTRTCQSDGSCIWSGEQPRCIIDVQCPTLTNPTNGRVSVPSRSVSSVARYSCSQGFTLVGSATLICLPIGRWSGTQPECQNEVHFSLNGRIYTNGSRVLIDDIGVDDNALHCVTSSTACCQNPKAGNFYYPDGSSVQYGDAGVYRTRIYRAIRLHLRDSALVATGRYVCAIPDSRGILKYVFVDIFRPYPTDIYPYDPYEPYDPYDPYPFYFCELNEDEYGRPYFGPYDEYRRPNRSTYSPNVYVRPNTTTVLPPRETYEPDYEELAEKNRGRTLTLPSCITSNECGQVPETCSGAGTRYDSCGRRCTCRNNRLQDCCRVRKEWRSMTQVERCRYVSVIVAASTQQPWKMCYDELIKIHRDEFRARPGIHDAIFFLPWHRWYILAFENLLRQIDCHVTVPYWDWSLEPQTWKNSILWATECGLGGNGNPNNNDLVETGPFGQGAWQLTPSANNNNGGSLRRRFNGDLPGSASVALDQRSGVSSFDTWERFVRSNLHDSVHCMIGGTMCNVDSANAPEFFLHHGFIDQIWGAWQNKGPAFKNLPFYSANRNAMPGAFRNSPQDVFDLKNQPGCVRVCVQSSSRPSRANTTYTPTCPREMNCYDYSPIKLAGIIPRPFPRVPEESFRLFNTSYAVRRTSNGFADILNDYDELYKVLQANGYASTSSYRPAYGEIQFDRYLYQPQITSYNPELPQPPLECRPYLPPYY